MQYEVNYLLKDGTLIKEIVDALNEEEVKKKYFQKGFIVLIKPIDNISYTKKDIFLSRLFYPNNFDLMLLSKELSILLKSGLTLTNALEIALENVTNKKLKSAIYEVKNDIISGTSLPIALKKHNNIFTDLFVKCVESGESASNVVEVFEMLAKYFKSLYQINSKILNVITYPIIVIFIALCIFLYLLLKVIPNFKQIFYEMKISTSSYIDILFYISTFLKQNIFIISVGFLTLIVFFMFTNINIFDRFKNILVKFLKSFPIVSKVFNTYSMFIFSGMLFITLKSHVNAVEAFKLSVNSLKNIVSDEIKTDAINVLQSGGSFSNALIKLNLNDNVLVKMCNVGEKSGKIIEMIEMLNEYYFESLQNYIERLTSVLEPIVILITGVFISILILSIFLPIIKITLSGI